MLHSNLRYYFAKVATFFGGGDNATELQEKREQYCQQMLLLLAVELHKRDCRLIPQTVPGKTPLDFKGPDETGHLAFWVAHRDVSNLHYGFNMHVDWSVALEATGRRAVFKLESWATRKRGLFYYGDMRFKADSEENKTRVTKDIRRIARFVSAEAMDFVNRYPPSPKSNPEI